MGCLFCSTKGATPPNFAEKTFANCEIRESFSLESFPLYSNTWAVHVLHVSTADSGD